MKKFLVKTHVLLLTLMVGLIASSSALAAATIVIQNNDQPGVGFNDPTPVAPVGGNNGSTLGEQRLNAFQFAANIWGATLNSGPPITVRASWPGLPCTANSGALATAGAVNIRRDFPGALFAATWYSVAIANSLSGSDLNGPTAEISAQFNVNVGTSGCLENRQWYYGLDTNHGINRINLVTVLLHEFSHGLGFQTFTDEETGAQFFGFASIYDRFLFDNTAGKTWVEMTNAERVASAINTGNLVWNGPQVTNDAATVLTGGKDSLGRPRMFAPNPVDSGSSVSHWDTVATPNQLMEPNISTSLSLNVTPPQDLTTSLMKDIGWPATVGPPPSPTPTPSPPPNDNFANAQAISGCSGSVPGTNVAATREIGEPNHSPDNNGGSRSVWYQWQSPSNSSVTLTTAGSNFDTVLGVYTGTAVGSLTLIANNDDVAQGNLSSMVVFAANAGTVYRIAVDGYNNDNSSGDVGTLSLNWSATNCTAQPTIQFSTSNYSAGEGNSKIDVIITRSGPTTGAASVGYATTDGAGLTNCDVVNGIASPRCDFAVSIGTVSFAAGETSKTFSIPIVDDSYAEGPENFTISLSNASGANLAAPSTATLTINDNESSNGPNPIALTAFFVRQHYIDFLGREPDPPGFAGWQNVINNCPQGDITCDRIHVSGAFYQSPEFQQRGYFVYRFYPVSFGRKPDYAEFIPDLARVSGFLDAAQLEAARVAFINDFMARPAFVSRYPATMSNTQYVNTLESTAGVTLPNKQAWIDALDDQRKTRAEVLREITESNEVSQRYFNQAFVVMQYFGYLRRDPDAFYLNWIAELDSTGNSRGMISGFVNSNEYRFRFGP